MEPLIKHSSGGGSGSGSGSHPARFRGECHNKRTGRLKLILTYGEPSSVSVFTTTGGVFPCRHREKETR